MADVACTKAPSTTLWIMSSNWARARRAARVAAWVAVARLADQLERAPAGGDGFAILGIVFLVLLVLEYTGTIDIFKKVP